MANIKEFHMEEERAGIKSTRATVEIDAFRSIYKYLACLVVNGEKKSLSVKHQ